jgi:hypothetical protein
MKQQQVEVLVLSFSDFSLTHETVAVRQKRFGGPDRGARSAV